MITKLELTNFKNFAKAEIGFGPVSLLLGANATGKSNVRDALRFLHGSARGYDLAAWFRGEISASRPHREVPAPRHLWDLPPGWLSRQTASVSVVITAPGQAAGRRQKPPGANCVC